MNQWADIRGGAFRQRRGHSIAVRDESASTGLKEDAPLIQSFRNRCEQLVVNSLQS